MLGTLEYIKYLKKSIGLIIILLLISISISIILGYYTYLTYIVYNKLYFSLDEALLLKLVILFFISTFILYFLNIIRQLMVTWIKNSILIYLRFLLINEIMKYKIEYFIKKNTGNLVKCISDDCVFISEGLSKICSGISNILIIFIWLIFFFIYIKWLFYIYLFIVIVSLLWAFLWKSFIEKTAFQIGIQYGKLYQLFWEVITGIKIIKVELLRKNVIKELINNMQKIKKYMMHNTIFNCILWNIRLILPCIAFILILFYGGGKVQEGNFTISLLAVSLMFIWRFVEPLSEMNFIIISIQELKSAIKRIEDYKDGKIEYGGDIEFKGIQNKINFTKVQFKYPGSNFYMKNINLTINKGESIAILGKTGSGKTTIFNMLLRFYDPVKGKIFLDGIDIKNFTLKSLREKIIIVPQETSIYSTTLRKNIDIKSRLSDDEIYKLLERVNLSYLISKLPKGLDTFIIENGNNLSGGEKQRIGIAKALALNGDIYIFDEITANLDPKTEKVIINSILNLGKNITTISITHNLTILSKIDRIFTIVNGSITELNNKIKNNLENYLDSIYSF